MTLERFTKRVPCLALLIAAPVQDPAAPREMPPPSAARADLLPSPAARPGPGHRVSLPPGGAAKPAGHAGRTAVRAIGVTIAVVVGSWVSAFLLLVAFVEATAIRM